jgi:hypothetical protein
MHDWMHYAAFAKTRAPVVKRSSAATSLEAELIVPEFAKIVLIWN